MHAPLVRICSPSLSVVMCSTRSGKFGYWCSSPSIRMERNCFLRLKSLLCFSPIERIKNGYGLCVFVVCSNGWSIAPVGENQLARFANKNAQAGMCIGFFFSPLAQTPLSSHKALFKLQRVTLRPTTRFRYLGLGFRVLWSCLLEFGLLVKMNGVNSRGSNACRLPFLFYFASGSLTSCSEVGRTIGSHQVCSSSTPRAAQGPQFSGLLFVRYCAFSSQSG